MRIIRKILEWLAMNLSAATGGSFITPLLSDFRALDSRWLDCEWDFRGLLPLSESREQLTFQQREAATVAALKIQTFIHDIETAMKAATKYRYRPAKKSRQIMNLS